MGAEARIKELGLTLPNPPKPMGNYVPGVRTGNLLFLSGHGPIRIEGNPSARGKVGRDLSTEDAYKVAREIPATLAQLPCYCYCDMHMGHKSLHSCFEDTHASECAVCVSEALQAYEMHQGGMSPEQIRERIIAAYSKRQ